MMYFLRLELEWISWIMVKIVRIRRNPEARFCFDTCSVVSCGSNTVFVIRTVDDQFVVIFELPRESGPFSRHCSHLFCRRESDPTLDKLEHSLLRICSQIFILITTEELSLEEFLDCVRKDVAIADLYSSIDDRMAKEPFLRRRIGIEETNVTLHKLPDRCETLFAVYTCTGIPLFHSAIGIDHGLLNIEDDWRNEVSH